MLDNNPFAYEVTEVSKKGKTNTASYIEAVLTTSKGTIKVLNATSMNRYRDYLEDFTQKLIITINTSLGDYEKLLLSDTSAITMTVTVYEIGFNSAFSISALANPKQFTYKAKLLEIDSSQISQNNPMSNNPNIGNLTFKEFSVQLLEPCFESVSIRTVGGVFRTTNGVDLIKTLLTNFSTDDEVDAITNVKGVDVVSGYNEEPVEQIIIPHMTPLTKAISLINDNCKGIYPTGFSFFLQNNLWYIFPPYDLDRFNKTNRTITVVNLPKDRLPGIEKTFFNSTTKLIVLSTRDSVVVDNREAKVFNEGSSIRFVDGDKLFNGLGTVADNKFLVNAGDNVNELALEARTDSMNVLRPTQTRSTSNKNKELSKLAKSRGFYMQLVWENSDDSLLHPGMPAKILFLKDNKPASATGVLIESETIWSPMEKSFKHVKLQRTSVITFFIGNEEYLEAN